MTKTAHDSETPAHGQQVITGCTFIYTKDTSGTFRVFLAKRAETKKFLPGVYEIPGGHIDYGEDIIDGVKREIEEEFSVNVRLADPFAAFTYVNKIKGSHSVEVIYFAELISDESEIRLNPEDHSVYTWASVDELSSLFAGDKGMDDIEAQKILRGFEILESGFTPKFT